LNTATRESPEALALSTAVGTAWRDVRDALSVLFTPALIAFLILLALEIVKLRIMPSTDLTAGLVEMFYDAVEAFLMTPYAIAVHRFIILGEKTMSYRIAPAEPRFQSFFGWSLALSVLYNAPAAFEVLPGPTILKGILEVALGIAAIVIGIRAILLFPAVAVDAPGANWRQAMADTKGYAWRIFLIIVLATLPFVIVAVIVGGVAAMLARMLSGRFEPTIAGDALMALKDLQAGYFHAAHFAIIGLFVYTLAVVIASRLYQWIGVRVKERG
jgi:hypothetical protein